MSKKDDYFALMEAQIKKWDAEVDKLSAKGAQLGAEARAKYDEQIKAICGLFQSVGAMCDHGAANVVSDQHLFYFIGKFEHKPRGHMGTG